MKKEEWRGIDGFVIYEVSSLGGVRSKARLVRSKANSVARVAGRQLKQRVGWGGYLTVTLYSDGKPYSRFVHRLVTGAFVDKIENKAFVNHKNGIKTSNSAGNLEWCTRSENVRHAMAMGLKPPLRGEMSSSSKLRQTAVIRVIKMLSDGELIHDISVETKINIKTISSINRHTTWSHLSENLNCPICDTQSDSYLKKKYSRRGLFDEKQLAEIREMHGKGLSQTKIAKLYGVSQATISKKVEDANL